MESTIDKKLETRAQVIIIEKKKEKHRKPEQKQQLLVRMKACYALSFSPLLFLVLALVIF
jgi:hypothetical protein